MSTITALVGSDGVTEANSMTKINTNFSNLNTDKMETSVLDTSTDLDGASASDAKVPSQLAVKTYADNLIGNSSALALIPSPAMVMVDDAENPIVLAADNTVGHVGKVFIPSSITVNKLTFVSGNVHTINGTVKFGLFSEDGATQYFSVTSPTITAADTQYAVTISSVLLRAGYYYFMALANGTTNTRLVAWKTDPYTVAAILRAPTSEPVFEGTITVTASTIPSTLSLGSITATYANTMIFRLDN